MIYRIASHEVYLKTKEYDHNPFPKKKVINTFTRNSGYVYPNDVSLSLGTYDELLSVKITDLESRNFVWVGNVGEEWNVYQYDLTEYDIIGLDAKLEDTTLFGIVLHQQLLPKIYHYAQLCLIYHKLAQHQTNLLILF